MDTQLGMKEAKKTANHVFRPLRIAPFPYSPAELQFKRLTAFQRMLRLCKKHMVVSLKALEQFIYQNK